MWPRLLFTCVFLSLAAATFFGCGDDDEETQTPGQTALASCNSLCDKQAAAQCGIPVETCRTACNTVNSAPECVDQFNAWLNCQHAQANVCNLAGCQSQSLAAIQCAAAGTGGTAGSTG
jgi:hypothetical protein